MIKRGDSALLKLFSSVFLFILVLSFVSAADPGHSASSVGPGSFEAGNYVFPNNLTIGGNNFFVDNSTGYIGIGTVSPTKKITIQTNVENDGLWLADTSSSSYFAGLAKRSDQSGYLRLYNAGSSTGVLIDGSGNSYLNGGSLGIGTTTPSRELDVRGIGNFSGTVYINNGTDLSAFIAGNGTGTYVPYTGANNNLNLGNNNLTINGTLLQINSRLSRVGIGTVNPNYKLEINSATNALNVSNTLFVNSSRVGIGTRSPLAALNILSTTESLRLSYDSNNYVSFNVSSLGKLTIGDPTHYNQVELQGRIVNANPALLLSPRIQTGSTQANAYALRITPTKTDNAAGDEVTNWYGLYVSSPTGSGTIENVYGAYFEDNVGIGNTTPLHKLEVNGVVNAHGYLVNGSALATGSNVSGTYVPYTGATGNVALGGNNLTLTGGYIEVNGGTNGRYFRIDASSFRTYGTSSSGWAQGLAHHYNNETIIGYSAAAYGNPTVFGYYFYGGEYNDHALTILPNKNVGIGTTSPSDKLEVRGSITSSYDSNTNTTLFVNPSGTGISIADSGSQLIRLATYGNNFINAGQNLGIGTNSPSSLLHVSAGTSGDSILTIEADTDNNNEGDNPWIHFIQDSGLIQAKIGLTGANDAAFGQTIDGALDNGLIILANRTVQIATNSGVGLTVNDSGFVGIGTTAPGYRLDVSGVVNAHGYLVNGSALATGSNVSGTYVPYTGATNNINLTGYYLESDDGTGGSNYFRIGSQGSSDGTAIVRVGNTKLLQYGSAQINLAGSYDLVGWKNNVSVGSSISSGNTETFRLSPDTGDAIFRGNLTVKNDSRAAIVVQNAFNTNSAGIAFQNNGSAYTWNIYRTDAGSNQADLRIAGGNAAADITDLTDILTITNTSRVGIGTTSPSRELDVRGIGNFSGTVYINNGTDILSYVNTVTAGNSSSVWNVSGSNVFPSSLEYEIGLGTRSPQALLHLNKSGNNARNRIILEVSGQNSNQDTSIWFKDSGEGVNWSIGADDNSNVFSISNSQELSENTRLLIDSSGNIGIGTNNPSRALDVRGVGNFSGTVYVNNGTDILSYVNTVTAGNSSGGSTNLTSSFVPYVGANKNVNLGVYNLSTTGRVGIGTSAGTAALTLSQDNGRALEIPANNQDVDIRIGQVSTNDYGFYWRYTGSGSGNANALQLWTEGQASSDVQVYNINQDGILTLYQNLAFSGNEKSITSSGAGINIEQTGDTLGGTRLSLQNRIGSNGAVFENLNLDLVDFAFKGNAGYQSSIRYEHRSSYIVGGSDTSVGEFQFIDAVAQGVNASIIFAVNKNVAYLNRSRLGIGTTRPSTALDVRGVGNFSGTVYVNNNTDVLSLINAVNGTTGWNVTSGNLYPSNLGNKVAVNTTTPTSTLEVKGTFNASTTNGGAALTQTGDFKIGI